MPCKTASAGSKHALPVPRARAPWGCACNPPRISTRFSSSAADSHYVTRMRCTPESKNVSLTNKNEIMITLLPLHICMPVIHLLVKNLEAPTLEGILKLRTGIVRVLRSDVATERSGSGLGGVCLGLTLIIKLITDLFFSWEASPIYLTSPLY